MSYCVWNERPPFIEEALPAGERIYQVGDKWVVTDQGKPSQDSVDDVLADAARVTQVTRKKGAALDALVNEQLVKRAKDVDAPAAVKEYAEAVAATADLADAVEVKVRGG